jgi:hypothetical protein
VISSLLLEHNENLERGNSNGPDRSEALVRNSSLQNSLELMDFVGCFVYYRMCNGAPNGETECEYRFELYIFHPLLCQRIYPGTIYIEKLTSFSITVFPLINPEP